MNENILEQAVQVVLPYIISLLEIMGISVVAWSACTAFVSYVRDMFVHKRTDFMFKFSEGLAIGLEFKMGAEILKTVLIREVKELLILGAVIILRAILSFLVHFEMNQKKNEKE